MSNIEPGSRTINGNSSSSSSSTTTTTTSNSSTSSHQEREKQGFVKFRKQQPQPEQPVGSPPLEPSSTASSPIVGWGGHGTSSAGARPAPTPSGAAITAVARPMRPSRDGRVSNPQPKQDGEQEKGGGGTGSGWGCGVGGNREEASSGGASEVMVQQRTKMPEESHGRGENGAAGSGGKAGGGDHCHDEGAEGDDGLEGSWDHQSKPDRVHARDEMSPRREGDDEGETEEQGGERMPGQHMKQHRTPEAENRTGTTDGHGVTQGGRTVGEAAKHPQPLSEGREYDQDTKQQQSPTQRSQGDVEEAFDRDARQTSPLPRPARPEFRGRDVPGQGQQQQQQDRPQTHDSDGFLTQASPQDDNNSSIECSYGYGEEDLAPPSDDGLEEPPTAFLREAKEGVKVTAKDTEDRQEGRPREQESNFFFSRPRPSASDHPNRREEGGGEEEQEDQQEQEERQAGEEEEQEQEEAIGGEKEGRERRQQHHRHNQELRQQHSVPRDGSTTVDDNRNNDEKAADQDHEMLPGRSPDEGEEHTEAEGEKRPQQGGRPQHQPLPQRSVNASKPPLPRGKKFNAFATGDDEEPAEEDKNQGSDSGADGGASSGHFDITGHGGAGAIVGGANAESCFGLATLSSSRRPVAKSGGQGGPIAPNRAANGSRLVVGFRASDAEQQGDRAKRGGMETVDDCERDDDERFAEEGKGEKRKREESQTILNRKVRDSFETITNSFLAASSTIRDVEAEQHKMIRDEDMIKRSLLKSGMRVRDATRAMQVQLLAAFAGDGSDDERDLTDEPRGNKGRATAQGEREGPATGSTPFRNEPPPRRPTAPSGARAAAPATSQPPHRGDGGGVGGRGTLHPSRPQQDQQSVTPSVDVTSIHSSFGASSGHHDGDRPSSVGRLSDIPTITSAGRADQGKQKLGPNGGRAVDRGSSGGGVSSQCPPPVVVGYGVVSRSGAEAGSALLRPRHARGAAARGSGGSSMPNGLGNGGASGLVGGGRGGRFFSSSSVSAKRPCRADFGRGRAARDSRSDERA